MTNTPDYEIRIGLDPSGQWIWNVLGIESGFAATVDDAFARAKLAVRRNLRADHGYTPLSLRGVTK
jgi:hypothetical protein